MYALPAMTTTRVQKGFLLLVKHSALSHIELQFRTPLSVLNKGVVAAFTVLKFSQFGTWCIQDDESSIKKRQENVQFVHA